jgi:hypothetical protein
MRTTLDIEDDVLQAAKELAAATRQSTGKALSESARRGLQIRAHRGARRGDVPLLASRGDVVTLEKVRQIMDEEGI